MKRSVVKALIELCGGASVASGRLPEELASRLMEDGVLASVSHGSKLSFRALPGFKEHLVVVDERLANPEKYLALMEESGAATPPCPEQGTVFSRSEQVALLGNSKVVAVRSCPGFPVNSYEPIRALLGGESLTIFPREGTFLYISDWQNFKIPSETLVVGVENMENFRFVRRQRYLFEGFGVPVLFVSRYPQSGDLVKWLSHISNRYLHFGDLDLAGVNIYLTEFYNRLGPRASFFVPPDVRSRLACGSSERYIAQYERFRNMSVTDPRVQRLVDFVNSFRRGYDQEGFIGTLHE